MFVNKKIHHRTRLQHYLFLVLLLGIIVCLAYLSTRYRFEADWTVSGRNSLSDASVALLEQMPDRITVTSYATEDATLRRAVSDVVKRYKRQKSNLEFRFINPDLVPDTVRELGISGNGELLIEYQQRRETLKEISEPGISNALQRLARGGDRLLVFLNGHGERKPQGGANHDLDTWVNHLAGKGFMTQGHNLAQQARLPANTRVLVVASPQLGLLAGEVAVLKDYLAAGGNLLWLTDPESRIAHDVLTDTLGVAPQPGVIVDPSTQLLGISDPRFALVAEYPLHAITTGFDSITLFPQALGLQFDTKGDWETQVLLTSHPRSWSETGELTGDISLEPGSDIPGPLTLGIAMQREVKDNTPHQQRVVIVGDGDFLSNAYLGNGGNLQLGLNIINWLAHDDGFIHIPETVFPDKHLQLSDNAQILISIGFLVVIPLLLAATGIFVWWRRRQA